MKIKLEGTLRVFNLLLQKLEEELEGKSLEFTPQAELTPDDSQTYALIVRLRAHRNYVRITFMPWLEGQSALRVKSNLGDEYADDRHIFPSEDVELNVCSLAATLAERAVKYNGVKV